MDDRRKVLRAGPSTHGLGLFSIGRLAKHAFVGPIEGDVIDDPDYESDYCMELSGRRALEPASPYRYVNHSCQPNCELVERDQPAGGHAKSADPELWLLVLADIAPGEEVTIDYAWPAHAAIPCTCGSPQCRGWIVAAEQLSEIAESSSVREMHHQRLRQDSTRRVV